jgi:uncharacterized protein YbjT (DUF2867 family)
MARALIVGCGCRGRFVGRQLVSEGWAVRGTSRREEGLAAIEEAGIEAVLADPGRPGTILDLIDDVAVLLLLLGSATGTEEELAAIHGPRLERLMEHLVETPVRGVVYEGTEKGVEIVHAAERTWRIPVSATAANPSQSPHTEDLDGFADEVRGLIGRRT